MKILLKNGLVYTGEKNVPFKSDVLINNGIIEKIQENIEEDNVKIIDCNNRSIAPGFIDAHSHNDFFVYNEDSVNYFSPFIKQGVTTQIVGNCGFSSYTVDKNSKYIGRVGGGLFKSNYVSSLHEWVEGSKGNLYVNVVPLVGHGSARCSVSGYRNKKLTDEQLTDMLRLIEEDLKAGAFGGSFGLMYQPGMYSDQEELVDVARLIKQYDGILTVHPRACSNISMGFPLYKLHHLELGLEEVADIVKKTGVRCEYSHLIFTGEKSWGRVNSMLNKIHKLNKLGYEIGYDMYPYTYGCSVINVLLPSYYLSLAKNERQKGFIPLKTKFLLSMTKVLLGIGFDDLKVSYISDQHPEYEGKSISQIAKEEKIKDVDAYLKLVELSDGKGRITMGKYYNETIIKRLMEDELSIFMTDAWYEEKGMQNGSAYTAYPLFIVKALTYQIPLENIIHKMTGAVADRFQIRNRGYIREGYAADIVIFDSEKINVIDDTHFTGITNVIINGEEVVENSNFIDKRKGIAILKNNVR